MDFSQQPAYIDGRLRLNYSVLTHRNTTQEEKTIYLIYAIYMSIIGIFALVGNSTLLLVICRDSHLRRKSHNLLLVNLAVADLMSMLWAQPLSLFSAYRQKWVFNEVACKMSAFFTLLFRTSGFNTILALCVFRYLIYCNPEIAFVMLTRKATLRVIGCCWMYSLFWATLPLFDIGHYGMQPLRINCFLQWSYNDVVNISYMVSLLFLTYVIHVVIIIACFVSVKLTRIFYLSKSLESTMCVVTVKDMMMRLTVTDDHTLTNMCFSIVLLFVFLWTPFEVINILEAMTSDLPLSVIALATLISRTSVMVNPVIYLTANSRFRLRVINVLCRPIRWCRGISAVEEELPLR